MCSSTDVRGDFEHHVVGLCVTMPLIRTVYMRVRRFFVPHLVSGLIQTIMT